MRASNIALQACVGGELGRLSGEGIRVDRSRRKSTLWAAARVDLEARWALPVASLGLDFALSVAAPLLRDEFVLDNVGELHQPANIVGRASIGLSWASGRNNSTRD